ncbi:MAG: hypothetical protein WAM04_00995 [Candidatus Sulfotelmatobacter sp.]
MSSNESTARNIAWGPSILVVLGSMLIVLGAARFVISHRFGFIDALYCCLAVVPSGLFLLVFAYVFQHAKLASVIPLFVGGILAFSFPVADVALGLALVGAIAVPALNEWKNEKRRPKASAAHGSENENRR